MIPTEETSAEVTEPSKPKDIPFFRRDGHFVVCSSVFTFMAQVFQRDFVTFQHLGIECRFHACQASALLHPITSQFLYLLVSVRTIYLYSLQGINYM